MCLVSLLLLYSVVSLYEHVLMKMYLYFELEPNIFKLTHFFSFSAWFSFSYWEGCQLSLLSSCYAYFYLLFGFAHILWQALCFLTGVHRQIVHSFYPSPWVRHSPPRECPSYFLVQTANQYLGISYTVMYFKLKEK